MDMTFYNQLHQADPEYFEMLTVSEVAEMGKKYLRYVRMCGFGRGMTSVEQEQAITDRIAYPHLCENFKRVNAIMFLRTDGCSYHKARSFVDAYHAWVNPHQQEGMMVTNA